MTDVEQAKAFIASLIQANERRDRLYWIAVRRSDGKAVGTLGLIFDTERCNETACEIGYGFSPETWASGLFQEAAQAVISFAVERWGYKTIIACTRHDNYPAIKSVEKIGFVLTETIPNYYPLLGKDCAVLTYAPNPALNPVGTV